MAKVLVVGGAGYVGSTTCAWLLDSGHDVWVLDDLSTGHRELLLGRGFTLSRCGNTELVMELVAREKFDCVMHFAGRCLVSESVLKPEEYHENNVVQTQRLVEALLSSGVRNFIFSSTCAVFGDPGDSKIDEALPKNPQSPYGQNKLDVEKYLEESARERGFRSICLRYFNAAGTEPKLRVGEWHENETHLIPRIFKAAAQGQPIEVYGTDYPTADGTCVRDYVHVWDLAEAHGLAMERLLGLKNDAAGVFEVYNLGSEKGHSVLEIIQGCEEVSGMKLQIVEKDRRPGDPPRLVADSGLAKRVLGFGKSRIDLKTQLASAWEWERKRSELKNSREESGLSPVLRRAVFLDRDGTINEDPGYLNDPAQLKLLPLAGEALSTLKKAGFLLVVVSNQSGVGRGIINAAVLPLIHEKLDSLLGAWAVKIDRYELCFHRPDQGCECRKPKPKLLLDAASALQIDVTRSYMVGDKESDLAAGYAAGCKSTVLVRTGDGAATESKLKSGQAHFIADSLLQAANWILNQENGGS